MKIPIIYQGQRAVFQGFDKKKRMYRFKTEDGKMHFANSLQELTAPEEPEQVNLFSNSSKSA